MNVLGAALEEDDHRWLGTRYREGRDGLPNGFVITAFESFHNCGRTPYRNGATCLVLGFALPAFWSVPIIRCPPRHDSLVLTPYKAFRC